ncbi:vWA domain-containing protein [Spongiactinospora sp. TRM90649]|uniref:vWA domain-containing protein n=1 Tax=Spongiactinospora sp. TRM90649 TaxID=3031114 RepID=UPI0023F6ADEB|nr:vWA domain-containing protein [Spongiactinospora sp. TRM90649]MDF5756551.1 VWA domain-containing protein [Spongiactinospora sp. TRM90649]
MPRWHLTAQIRRPSAFTDALGAAFVGALPVSATVADANDTGNLEIAFDVDAGTATDVVQVATALIAQAMGEVFGSTTRVKSLSLEPIKDHATTRRHITIVLDRSGSMERVRDDAEGGLHAFLDAQADVSAETTVSLVCFDHEIEITYEGVALSDVPPSVLQPRGRTALYDAIGEAVHRTTEYIGGLDAERRPQEIVVVIQTDGRENASREYDRSEIKRLITSRQEQGWTFVFLSATPDAFAVGSNIGVPHATTVHYGGTNTRETLTSAGHMVARGSRTGDYRFSEDERDASRCGDA